MRMKLVSRILAVLSIGVLIISVQLTNDRLGNFFMGLTAFTPKVLAETPEEAAVEDVTNRALSLVARSGAPLSFQEAIFITTVTPANRDAIVEDIISNTATVMASNWVVTGVKTLQEGLDEGLLNMSDVEEYHTFVDSLVEVDDLVVSVSWVRTSDDLSLTTTAVVNSTNYEMIYDPLITSWRNPGPYPGTPDQPTSGGLGTRTLTTWTWRPFPQGATIAEMIFGKDTVWKYPVMIVTFDDEGNVVSESEDPQVHTFIDTATVSQKTEIIGNCKRWSFRVHWATPTVTIKIKVGTKGFNFDVEFGGIGSSGTDLEVYEICSNGKGTVLEGPGVWSNGTDICYYGSRDQAFAGLMAHDIDFYDYPLTYTEYVVACADPTIQLAGSSPNEIYAFAFNNNWTIPSYPGFRNPLNYIGFRQAIAHLVDKDYIAEGIMDGFAEVVDAPLPAAYAGYANESMTGNNYPYSYSPLTANAVLDASGWVQGSTPNPYYDGGFPGSASFIRTYPPGHSKAGMDLDPIIFYASSYDSLKLAASQYFRDNLRKVGIPVDFRVLSLEACHPSVMDEHDYHIYTADMSFRQYMPYPTYLYRLFHSTFFFSNGGNYVTGMNASDLPNYPELDGILEQVYHAPDVMSFVDAVKRATGFLIEKAISIWLVNPVGWYAYRKNVVSIVNMKGVGVVNGYTFLNARKVDDPDTVGDESLQPLKVGTVYAPINLNILYSRWDCDYAVLDRVFSRLLKVNPYNPSIINPWIAQDYETTIWYDPSDDENKSKVTFWLRKDVYWHAPVTGDQVRQFNAYDVEFSIWYINLFEDSWHWGTTREVHHTVVLNDFTIEVYFNDESIFAPYGIGLEMPLLPGEEYMDMIGLLMNPKGYYLADLDWDLTFYSLGTHYPTEMYRGVGGCVTLKSNPTHFLSDSPLGEIDWMWYWSGTTKPRSGYYQINLYDAVTLLTAYGTRGDGVPPSNWFPGADIDSYDLCHVGLYDAVILLTNYGKKFGTPPP
jgi:ABC-type transport system substrate-binding protein